MQPAIVIQMAPFCSKNVRYFGKLSESVSKMIQNSINCERAN